LARQSVGFGHREKPQIGEVGIRPVNRHPKLTNFDRNRADKADHTLPSQLLMRSTQFA
jgi:hypothetical protein